MNEDLRLCDCCLKAVVKGKYCPPCKQSRLSTIEEIEKLNFAKGFKGIPVSISKGEIIMIHKKDLDQLKREK